MHILQTGVMIAIYGTYNVLTTNYRSTPGTKLKVMFVLALTNQQILAQTASQQLVLEMLAWEAFDLSTTIPQEACSLAVSCI